jgi:hypothetical protein
MSTVNGTAPPVLLITAPPSSAIGYLDVSRAPTAIL